MAEDLEDSERGGFEHRVIPAAGAARPSTSAPNSVFAMGGEAPTAKPGAKPRAKQVPMQEHEDRALQHIEACGELTTAQLAQVMQVSIHVARKVLQRLTGSKRVVCTRKDGAEPYWGKKISGLRSFLQKKAAKEIAATGAAPQLVSPPPRRNYFNAARLAGGDLQHRRCADRSRRCQRAPAARERARPAGLAAQG